MAFLYNGVPVAVPWTADIPYELRAEGNLAHCVQAILDATEPWEDGQNPVETAAFDERITPIAISTTGRRVMWGIHKGHKAKKPRLQPSPFVQGDRRILGERIGLLTIELYGSPEHPRLVRAYGGDYTPPLPWMSSAPDAIGGRDACLDYWRQHAYRDVSSRLIVAGTMTRTPPKWF